MTQTQVFFICQHNGSHGLTLHFITAIFRHTTKWRLSDGILFNDNAGAFRRKPCACLVGIRGSRGLCVPTDRVAPARPVHRFKTHVNPEAGGAGCGPEERALDVLPVARNGGFTRSSSGPVMGPASGVKDPPYSDGCKADGKNPESESRHTLRTPGHTSQAGGCCSGIGRTPRPTR